jgi:hypothetical protein
MPSGIPDQAARSPYIPPVVAGCQLAGKGIDTHLAAVAKADDRFAKTSANKEVASQEVFPVFRRYLTAQTNKGVRDALHAARAQAVRDSTARVPWYFPRW